MSHVKEHCKTPRHWLSRFEHRPWVCTCGQAWVTECYLGVFFWRPWPFSGTRAEGPQR